MGILDEFQKDICDLNAFSYEDYKNSSLDLKLKKIELLNSFYRARYNNLSKLPIFIDIDGVTLDTMNFAKRLLYMQYGIDYDKRDRKNVEEQKIIASFFKSLDWKKLLVNTREINRSIDFIKLINDSSMYLPTLYSAVNSEKEQEEKANYFAHKLPGIEIKFIQAHSPKECTDPRSVLIDDDNFNLVNWAGYPLHFDSCISTFFPNINDLGELYYLFYRAPDAPEIFIHKEGLYCGLIREKDIKTKKITWKKKSND